MIETQAPRPRLRGRLHQIAFFVSVPLGGTLIALAQTVAERITSGIYAFTLSGLYAASAAFHRIQWRPRAQAVMQRLDHSMIYVLIAGTYTPFAALVLPTPWSTTILAFVWIGAVTGIVLRTFSLRLQAVQQALYMVLGWTAVVTLPLSLQHMGPARVGLLFAGGLFYTVGAIMFALKKPDPVPTVFGYHEVWHSMVIAGSLCHYILILSLVLTA